MASFLKVLPKAAESAYTRALRGRLPGGFALTGRWIAVALVFFTLVIISTPHFHLHFPNIEEGAAWTGGDIYSPFALTVRAESVAESERQRIENRYEKVFRFDGEARRHAEKKVSDLMAMARTHAAAHETTGGSLQHEASRKLGVNLTPETVQTLVKYANNERVPSDLNTTLQHFFSIRGMSADKSVFEPAARAGRLAFNLTAAGDEPATTPTADSLLAYPGEAFNYLENRYLASFSVSADLQSAYADICRQLLRPNIVYDPSATALRKQAAYDALRPFQVINRGDRIIGNGEKISPLQAAALERMESQVRYFNLLSACGTAIFVALAMGYIMAYLFKFCPNIPFTAANVALVAFPVIWAILLGRAALLLGLGRFSEACILPAGMIGMLGVILFDTRVAIMLVTAGTALFGFASGLSFPAVLIGLAGGYTGVASLYTMKERKEMLIAGARVAMVNCLAVLAMMLIRQPENPNLTQALGGLMNGIACYILTVGTLPVLEIIFRITTDVRLMELTSSHHPLLREMEEKAPGSFQHSLNVAALAESAAEDIGAHYLLVRAGAYFHDVGKMLKPKYYTENQITPDERRIHSKLSPHMSNLIIRNHVKDGVELARDHHLPERVIDFIPQHHGTGLIKFFYAQAVATAEANDAVHEEEFRYPGPKPQTIEAAIVMLADTVEATATARFSSKMINEDDLRKMVRDSIFDKFNDGQFDECHMTFRDLHRITESFVKSLLSRFHHRVDYPTMPKREIRDITRVEKPVTAGATS